MGRGLRVLALTVILLGCGGRSPELQAAGFINQTSHTDAALWTIWVTAQQNLASEVDLNPVQQSTANAPPEVLPGDARALTTKPYQLLVAAEPDVSSQALFAATGIRRSAPTGMIACPHPCDVSYTTAYSRYQPSLTKFAASWEFTGSNFNAILQYEFENQILFALGYDMRWR